MRRIHICLLALCASSFAFSAPAPTGPAVQSQPTVDCSQLNPDELSFAAKMTSMQNKMTFCNQFTPEQRMQAMQMGDKPDASGKMMSPDDAVQKVMQMHNMAPTPMAQPRTGGGCPVK
ncbi:MAG: hypothetical protein JSS61_04465 [Verrucomicrobia bacterium]|nr:hypothetical protein [Verrucomicrobiota bacterium]